MKTATNWQKGWSVAIELARRQDPALGDRVAGYRQPDQTALTFPVGRVICLLNRSCTAFSAEYDLLC